LLVPLPKKHIVEYNRGERGVFVSKKTFPRWAVGLFFAAFLLLGLLTAADYGATWDEQDEMDILRMNLWEYSRALGLDESAFEKRTAGGNELTISVLTPISESIEQDHGIAAFYPMAGVVMSESLTEAQRSAVWHMWCWCVFALGAYALYGACRQLGMERGAALAAPLMLLLSPQFFAHGHFNNKDIALMSLAVCVLWQALRLMKKPTFATGLLFSFFGALAANTKVAGSALWGLCALFVLIVQIVNRRMKGRVWAVAGVTLVSFFGFYALLTPALWADPAAFIEYLVVNALGFQRWQNTILFRGALFDLKQTSLPFYYLPYMVLVTTPVWLLICIAAGTLMAVARKPRLDLWLVALMWALPLGFAVLTGTSVYNGWRHFYFVYGPMLVLGAWAVSRISGKKIMVLGLCVCMAFGAVELVVQHPYQQAYYQPLVRMRGEDYNELDYWNVSARDALVELAAQTEGEVTVWYADRWTWDALRKAVILLPEETAQRITLTSDAQYVLVNPTYQNFSGYETTGEPVVDLKAYGQSIMQIYERIGE